MITQIYVIGLEGIRTYGRTWTEEHVGFKSINYYKYSRYLFPSDNYGYWMIACGEYPR